MTDPIQTLKGFRDFIGVEAATRLWLINKIRTVFERYGFEPLETPALEYKSLLTGKYGAEADKLLYSFTDRGDREVALRYDQTIPVARVVSQYQSKLTFPYKRYQIQPVWRADKPQQGRYREFFQCDADIIGSDSLRADAEILAVYVAIYQEIGLKSIKIKLNDRQSLIQTIKNNGISEENIFTVIQTIDKLDKKTEQEVTEELIARGVEKNNAKKLLSTLQNAEAPPLITQLQQILTDMGFDKDIFEYAPTLARGLDYYTGMIFEGYIPDYKVGSVGGGGRYDNLIGKLVGVEKSAVGFGLGFDRTLEAAQLQGVIPELQSTAVVLVSVFSPELLPNSLKTVTALRKAGVSTELYLEDKALDKQFKYANTKKIPYVIIIGPEEAVKDTLQLKNMKSGEQKELSFAELVKELVTYNV